MRSLTNDPGSLVVTALQRAGAKRFRLWSALGVAGATGLYALASYGTQADAVRTLGCEDVGDWSSPSGATLSSSAVRTQGDGSLAIATSGYTTVQSRLLGPLGAVADHISVDLRVPTAQPNPSWTGALQAYVSSPTLGVYERYLGEFNLGVLTPGAFSQLAFSLPSELRSQLSSGSYYDFTIKFALNVPAGVVAPSARQCPGVFDPAGNNDHRIW